MGAEGDSAEFVALKICRLAEEGGGRGSAGRAKAAGVVDAVVMCP